MKVFVGLVFLCVLGFGLAQVWPGTPGQGQPPPTIRIHSPDPGMHSIVVNPSEVREMLADGQFVYAAYDWTVVKLAKKDLRILAWRSLMELPPEPKPVDRRLNLSGGKEVDIRDALREVFRQAQVSYTISPDVRGSLTMPSAINVPFETGLREILNVVGATYRVEAGIFHVLPKRNEFIYDPPKIGKMAMDGSDLYVSLGLRVVRLSKKDLSIVFERNIAISPNLSEKSGR